MPLFVVLLVDFTRAPDFGVTVSGTGAARMPCEGISDSWPLAPIQYPQKKIRLFIVKAAGTHCRRAKCPGLGNEPYLVHFD